MLLLAECLDTGITYVSSACIENGSILTGFFFPLMYSEIQVFVCVCVIPIPVMGWQKDVNSGFTFGNKC